MAKARRGSAVALMAALVASLVGCSWGQQEPGLFTSPDPAGVTPTSSGALQRAPARANPRLPVLAEAVWTTGDGNGLTVRFAVHGVRRTAGATVLDWSVTPLARPGRHDGDLVPSGTDLGLSRTLPGEQAVALLDGASGRVYRPLADVTRQRFSRCLCTPLVVVTPGLRFGETTLLQLAYPPLPTGISRVDVVLPNVAVVPGVPVTPVGLTPAADVAVELLRAAAVSNPVTGAKTWTAPDGTGARQTVVVAQVVATRALTSIVWTLHSVDDQPGLGSSPGPPVSAPQPGGLRLVTDNPASGPQLAVPGRRARVGVRWTTATYAGRPAYECLCSGLGLWSRGLRRGGGSAQLATHVGPLPEGTRRVDVLFPGLPAFTDVPVAWREDVAERARDVAPATAATWTYDELDPPRGWTPQDWPTPLPDPVQLGGYASRTQRVLAALP